MVIAIRSVIVFVSLAVAGCATGGGLEDRASSRVQRLIEDGRKRVEQDIIGDPRFKETLDRIKSVYEAEGKLSAGTVRGEYVFSTWLDDKHPQGVWRRVKISRLSQDNPEWEHLLDLDELSRIENSKIQIEGASCLPPSFERCLISLSHRGEDAVEIREFDMREKRFVEAGFSLPRGKHAVTWVSADEILVATNWGEGTTTKSGMPRILKSWRRGEAIHNAAAVLNQGARSASVSARSFYEDGKPTFIGVRRRSWADADFFHLKTGGLSPKLPLPVDAVIYGVFRDNLLFGVRNPWEFHNVVYPAGSVVALQLTPQNNRRSAALVFSPGARQVVLDIQVLRNFLVLNVLDDLNGLVVRVEPNGNEWKSRTLHSGELERIEFYGSEGETGLVLVSFESYLTEPSIRIFTERSRKFTTIRKMRPLFDSKNMIVRRGEAKSEDGTMVPFIFVGPKEKNQNLPTILTGYGSVRFLGIPFYLSTIGKAWIEPGGAWVFAHVRGGLEFGPTWVEGAKREKRVNAFADMAAVAREIVSRGWSSTEKIGIFGLSKGGLLAGATTVRYPDRFKASVLRVPILDMVNFSRWAPGMQWIDELGNPQNADDRKFLEAYSPIAQLKKGINYPTIFLLTASNDDVVHPAHARNMAGRLEEIGSPFYFYEASEGGHMAAADIFQRSFRSALELTFFRRELGL